MSREAIIDAMIELAGERGDNDEVTPLAQFQMDVLADAMENPKAIARLTEDPSIAKVRNGGKSFIGESFRKKSVQ